MLDSKASIVGLHEESQKLLHRSLRRKGCVMIVRSQEGDRLMNHLDTIGRIEYEITILIRRATRTSKNLGGLDRSAYLLLRQLKEYGAVGVKTLADEFHLDISTVSRQAAALALKGYAQRLPDSDDGRASNFKITDLGLLQLSKARQARQARFTELLKGWSPLDREKFGEYLSRLNRNIIES
jgi:DNA-binding MarR family transcriptional regulator